MTALEVYDLYRALYSFRQLVTSFKGGQVKLLEVSISTDSDSKDHAAAGQIKFSKKSKKILVGCGDGKAVEIVKLMYIKKTMTAADFHNGFLSKINDNEKKFE